MLSFQALNRNKTQIKHKCDVNYVEVVINIIRTFFFNLTIGESPPPSHFPTIIIVILGAVFGSLMSIKGILENGRFNYVGLIGLSILIPSLYISWMLLCCWKGINGYDWWQIPHF